MKKILFYSSLTILVIAISWGLFFLYEINYFQNKITIIPENSSMVDTLTSLMSKDKKTGSEKNERINVLLMGIAGKGKPGQYLTDTIMVASINPGSGKTALLSLPRDLLVTVPETKTRMKINSTYQYGLSSGGEKAGAETIKQVIEDITSLEIDHWVILNFDGFKKIIDAVGPINVTSERDIYDPRYPGPNYSYEIFELKKGFHQMDGATALKYARERHDDPEGDFGRAKRQQKILEATKNKVFSMGTYLDVSAVNDLFNALGDNIRTDITPGEFSRYLDLAKKMDTQNVNNVVVDAWNKESLLKVSHVEWKGVQAFVLIPRSGNWSEIHDLAQNVFDLDVLKRRSDEIAKEDASIFIIDKSEAGLSDKILRLLRDNFGHKNVATLRDIGNSIEDETAVYDFTGGQKPFTLDEIIKKLPARNRPKLKLTDEYESATSNVSPDFLVVIGKDAVPRYNMKEASVEDYRNAPETNEYTEFIGK